MSLFEKTKSWYGRYERPISSLSLIGGFLFDIVTLKRLDTLWENFWILSHIILVGIFIFLIHTNKNENNDEGNPSKKHFWYVNILQFFFGGLLSAFLVFYFRSTDIWATWPFLLILAIAFIANESMKRYYIRLSFQVSLLFLSIYSFMIFFMPIIMHEIGIRVFIISGLISLLVILIFVGSLFAYVKNRLKENKNKIIFLIFSIFVFINILYFTNLIPPIPLSLKDGGVYNNVEKRGGVYVVSHEDYSWERYFNLYKEVRRVEGEPLYAYSAVFSPDDLDLDIIHEWQFFNEKSRKWVTSSIIDLDVVGGRDGGFRTYSMKSSLSPGKWRVNIKTTNDQLIGRLRFILSDENITKTLVEEIKK